MKKLGFVFDARRCNGCRACVIACKEQQKTPDGVWLRQVKETPNQMMWLSVACNHCEKPACVPACPVKAYTQEPDGLVVQDHAKCIGCQACIAACPFKAPVLIQQAKRSLSVTAASSFWPPANNLLAYKLVRKVLFSSVLSPNSRRNILKRLLQDLSGPTSILDIRPIHRPNLILS